LRTFSAHYLKKGSVKGPLSTIIKVFLPTFPANLQNMLPKDFEEYYELFKYRYLMSTKNKQKLFESCFDNETKERLLKMVPTLAENMAFKEIR
jgi:hypothetical protein